MGVDRTLPALSRRDVADEQDGDQSDKDGKEQAGSQEVSRSRTHLGGLPAVV